MNKRILKLLIFVVGLLFPLLTIKFIVFPLISNSIDKSEIVECKKLQSYNKNYESFFLTKWQAEMCIKHGIHIDAPVGSYYEKN